MTKYDIVSAGMIRSGSTMVYQVIKALLTGHTIYKTHDYIIGEDYSVAVCTYRDPVDASISLARVTHNGDDIQEKTLDMASDRIMVSLGIINHYANEGKALMLKYELFVQNKQYMFDKLSEHLKISIDEHTRSKISAITSIDSNKCIASRFNSFREFDTCSQIHGLHILTPMPKEARRLISFELVKKLEYKFKGAYGNHTLS